MNALWRFGLITFCLLPGIGCITPNHRALELALSPEGGDEGIDLASRNRVYVYIVNGNDPFSNDGIAKLRTKLNEAGFAKVSSGGLFYSWYFASTIRKQHAADPEPRFIIVGYGFGVTIAESLAAKLHGEGVPIDSVIALAPRTIPGWNATPEANVPHISLDAATAVDAAELVLGTVMESGFAVPQDEVVMMAVLPMIDNAAPLPMSKPVIVKAIPPVKKPVTGILTGTQIR
jgi:hypothetical protein